MLKPGICCAKQMTHFYIKRSTGLTLAKRLACSERKRLSRHRLLALKKFTVISIQTTKLGLLIIFAIQIG